MAGVQVDLLVQNQKKEKILLVEVKSLNHEAWLDFRLSAQQRRRLERALQCLIVRYEGHCVVEFCLATVGPSQEVQFYTDIW